MNVGLQATHRFFSAYTATSSWLASNKKSKKLTLT